MKTGIIMEISGKQAIVMETGGRFRTIPMKDGYKEGDVVQIGREKHTVSLIYIAACVALLLFLGRSSYKLYFTQEAILSIDVNPSIELEVNRFGRIVSTRAFNREGAEILSAAAVKYKSYEEALGLILDEENERGYLNDEGGVVITVYAEEKEQEFKISAQAKKKADDALLSYQIEKEASVFSVDGETVEGAHRCGVSSGKYMYLERLKELMPDLDFTEYTHHSIEQIKSEIEDCKNQQKESSGISGDTQTEPENIIPQEPENTIPQEPQAGNGGASAPENAGGHHRRGHHE